MVYVLDCISLNCMVISLQNSVLHSNFLVTPIFYSKLFHFCGYSFPACTSRHCLEKLVIKSLNMGFILYSATYVKCFLFKMLTVCNVFSLNTYILKQNKNKF